jgi:hypothetical protein
MNGAERLKHVSRSVNSRTPIRAYEEPLSIVCLFDLGLRAPVMPRVPIPGSGLALVPGERTPHPTIIVIRRPDEGRSKIQCP